MKNVNMNVLNYIIKDVELSLARLGINTQLSIVEEKDYKNENYLAIDSTPFQTMPMIFKTIKLDGHIYIMEDKKKENIIKITIRLDYRYQTFDDGSNGHSLGMIQYDVEKDYWEGWNGVNARYAQNYIFKTKGLSI